MLPVEGGVCVLVSQFLSGLTSCLPASSLSVNLLVFIFESSMALGSQQVDTRYSVAVQHGPVA